ncbi:hypothetical protein [Pelotomaculum terephthalicicum]|nr:hypothetical protein [Pelotomaculum terephthalicicum]
MEKIGGIAAYAPLFCPSLYFCLERHNPAGHILNQNQIYIT